ncbi:MAG: hexokinase [Bacteroidia bacterium]|nr:hexokinase [Bacteroidia bacterium]
MKKSEKFLKEHRMRADDINIQQLVEIFTSEMLKGLESTESSLRMIPTYIEADNEFLYDVPVVAIDAGGTNFRAARVVFSKNGKLEISNIVNARMPGLEGEISKAEFFQTIAGYVKALAEESDRIGFCFSYPTEILPDKDGKLLQFCKEVQAPGVVGQLIGKNLLETLGMPGKQIVLLNDTVATLLAGKSASSGRNYDSFIGYILGTGTNTCYIESNRNILKNPGLDPNKSQIINIESGNFGKAPRTDLDISFDNTTGNPGNYTFEKMFSGGYFGDLCLSTLKTAANERVFCVVTASNIMLLNELSSEDVNSFVCNSTLDRGPLYSCIKYKADEENCIKIIESLIERAAKLAAANMAAVVLKTNKGKSPGRPVLITIEGTTFYKMHNLRYYFEKYLGDYLHGERQRFYEFAEVQQSSLVGAALAVLIN